MIILLLVVAEKFSEDWEPSHIWYLMAAEFLLDAFVLVSLASLIVPK